MFVQNTLTPKDTTTSNDVITPNDVLRLKNIERISQLYVSNFQIPQDITIKQNNLTQTIKGYLDGRFVLYIDISNNILIFTPYLQQIIIEYTLGKNIVIVQEDGKNILADISQAADDEKTISYVIYRRGEFIL